jgi:hypothetical protein
VDIAHNFSLAKETGPPGVGAPGPIAGAGLSILAIGYGAYWIIKRYRKTT